MKSGHVKPARRRKRRKSIFVQKKRRSSAVDVNAAGSGEVRIALGYISKFPSLLPPHALLHLIFEGLISNLPPILFPILNSSLPLSASKTGLVVLGHFEDFCYQLQLLHATQKKTHLVKFPPPI